MMCPFCIDEGFSLSELKTHLLSGSCKSFNQTRSKRVMKLYIAADDHEHAILVADEDSNDIAEFFHSDHATVGQSYETALMLANALVAASLALSSHHLGTEK